MCNIFHFLSGYPSIPIEIIKLEDPVQPVLLRAPGEQGECQHKVLREGLTTNDTVMLLYSHLESDHPASLGIHEGEHIVRVGADRA